MDKKIKPGDIYEDCSYHPCLCTHVDYEKDEINGISLIDGTSPRSCSLEFCGVKKLTLSQAIEWKNNGPSDPIVKKQMLPDRQWWFPKSQVGINPGNSLSFLFFIILNSVRNNKEMKKILGEPMVGWHEPYCTFIDEKTDTRAQIKFIVKGPSKSATIIAQAKKNKAQWDYTEIIAKLSNSDKEFIIK